MTIKEFIVKNEMRFKKERIEKLTELSAPSIIIEREKELLEKLERGEIKITGDLTLLQEELKTFEKKTGRGGKTYLDINDSILYFPSASYGRFITRKEEIK